MPPAVIVDIAHAFPWRLAVGWVPRRSVNITALFWAYPVLSQVDHSSAIWQSPAGAFLLCISTKVLFFALWFRDDKATMLLLIAFNKKNTAAQIRAARPIGTAVPKYALAPDVQPPSRPNARRSAARTSQPAPQNPRRVPARDSPLIQCLKKFRGSTANFPVLPDERPRNALGFTR